MVVQVVPCEGGHFVFPNSRRVALPIFRRENYNASYSKVRGRSVFMGLLSGNFRLYLITIVFLVNVDPNYRVVPTNAAKNFQVKDSRPRAVLYRVVPVLSVL